MLSKKLLKKTAIPEVRKVEGIIRKPLLEEFWETNGIRHLEEVRLNIRELMRYIDPKDEKYVTSNFEDKIYDIIGETNGYNIGEPQISSFYSNNTHRLEEIIRNNQQHITISRIINGQTVTLDELVELEKLLLSKGVKKEYLENEIGGHSKLASFVINLMGLSEDKVEQSFANFINDHQLNSVQIQFLDTIKQFLTKNGKIDPTKLYDAPFKNFHNLRIDGVFNEEQADKIFTIIEKLNERNNIA